MLVAFELSGIQYEQHGSKFFCWPVGYKGLRKQIKKAEFVAARNVVEEGTK